MSLFVTLHIHIESGRITCVSVGHLAFPVSASCQKNHSTKKLDADLQHHLVGGVEHDFYFSIHIGNVLIPTDFHSIIFQRGGLKPPTRLIHRILMDIYTILIYPGYIYIYMVGGLEHFSFFHFFGQSKKFSEDWKRTHGDPWAALQGGGKASLRRVPEGLSRLEGGSGFFFFWVRFWMFGGSALRSSRVKNAMNIFSFPLWGLTNQDY